VVLVLVLVQVPVPVLVPARQAWVVARQA